jgi:hypothetical protein
MGDFHPDLEPWFDLLLALAEKGLLDYKTLYCCVSWHIENPLQSSETFYSSSPTIASLDNVYSSSRAICLWLRVLAPRLPASSMPVKVVVA